jgi:peptide/nickel transport system substrate-binding protein
MGRPRSLGAAALALLTLGIALPAAARDDLVLGMTLEPPHLDPTAGAAGAIDEVTYANVFEGLTRIDAAGTVAPALAESWTVSDDGLTYTFHLRRDVVFHDGTAFDSADVRFAFERAMAPDSVNAQKGYFDAIARIETPEPHEVVLHLSRPDGLLPFHLGQGDAVIVAPESAAINRTRPVGTGPFRFVEWVEGDRVVLERFPDYWNPDEPRLERVTIRFIADPAAQTAALLAGDLDAFPSLAAPESVPLFEGDPRFAVEIGTTEGEVILAVNHRRPPFDDRDVRGAMALAVNRHDVVNGAMFGYGTIIGSHFPPHHPAQIDLTWMTPYDPHRTELLLPELGYPDGFSAVLTLPPPSYARRGGEIVQALLAQVGITVELEPVEWAQWLERVFRNHDYDMTIVAHTEPLDIGIYARGDDYYFGYDSPRFNEAYAALERTADPAARAALHADLQRILAEDVAAIFLFQLPKLGVHDARLRGLWTNSPIQANDVTRVHWAD